MQHDEMPNSNKCKPLKFILICKNNKIKSKFLLNSALHPIEKLDLKFIKTKCIIYNIKTQTIIIFNQYCTHSKYVFFFIRNMPR